MKKVERSLVFDLGGGTLDCAIMEHNPRRNTFALIATHGDSMLGGNDWDQVISEYFAQKFMSKWHVQLEEDDGNVAQAEGPYRLLALEAEKAKIHFTYSTETYYGHNNGFYFSQILRDILPLEATLTHETYLKLTRPLRVRCLQCVNTLLKHVQLTAGDIDHILLVGAMTRDPPVRMMLKEFFNKEVEQEEHCPADYAVAIGAAVRTGMLLGEFPLLASNTRFVSGTVQSTRTGNLLRRSWNVLWRTFGPRSNPNAVGTRWRGKARGLSDDEISNYAKEIVQFEATNERRLLLERAESDANAIMRRVANDSNKRQGMQERRVVQLTDQLKFWQYMVHNFHDHEEELAHTVNELEHALNELEGFLDNTTSGLTSAGTIDFTGEGSKRTNNNNNVNDKNETSTAKSVHGNKSSDFDNESTNKSNDKHASQTIPLASTKTNSSSTVIVRKRATHVAHESNESSAAATNIKLEADMTVPDKFMKLSELQTEKEEEKKKEALPHNKLTEGECNEQMTSSESYNEQEEQHQNEDEERHEATRYAAPLPVQSEDAHKLIKAGHPMLLYSDVEVKESIHSALLEDQVRSRAWHEPPQPPDEKGSWRDVMKAIDNNEPVGQLLSPTELLRPMTMREMLYKLQSLCEIDDLPSEEHVRANALHNKLQTMVIVEGDVNMREIQHAINEEEKEQMM